jgi:hypothetical protein
MNDYTTRFARLSRLQDIVGGTDDAHTSWPDGAAIALADAYAALLASARECVSCVATANRSCDAADRELSRLEADLRAKPLVDAAVDH